MPIPYDVNGRLNKLQSPADGTTTYTYDGAGAPGTKDGNGLTQWGLLSSKTKGDGDYELYDYDTCDELTSIGYWFFGGTMQNALTYSYDPAGNVKTVNQGYYSTTYGYDGADQLMSETSTGSYPPPTVGYTYDKNGNRLTQTKNGQPLQSFTYDAHDKLTSGTSGNETDTYDLNGSETSTTINGVTYRETYDDEDRLTSIVVPNVGTDTFVYNGLGLRVGKTDSTGTYSYLCDGTSPGADVLYDGHAVYTAGLSETRNGASAYYSNDRLGNLWTLDGSGKNQLTYEDFTGFGSVTAGSNGQTPFGYGGGNGCLTDADTGLVLMGYRYYDTRIGRFITQDPIGDGDNWYAYADNSPVNAVDPTGLSESSFSYNSSMSGQLYPGGDDWGDYRNGDYGTYNEYGPNGSGDGKLYYCGTLTVGPSVLDVMMQGGMGLNMGGGAMFAGSMQQGPKGTTWRTDMGEADGPDMHIYHKGDVHGPETNIDKNGKLRTGKHGVNKQELKELPKKLKQVYRPIIKTFLQRAGMAADAIEEALNGLTLDIPIVVFYNPASLYHRESNGVDVTPHG